MGNMQPRYRDLRNLVRSQQILKLFDVLKILKLFDAELKRERSKLFETLKNTEICWKLTKLHSNE